MSDLASRLALGLNGDPDQRAATTLLATGVGGVWLTKLHGWDQYLVATTDSTRPGALWIDWQQLRADLTSDRAAIAAYTAWAESPEGRRATEDQHDARWDRVVGDRPWHGASTGELAILDIALAIAPGGLLAEGIAGLDPGNRQAVTTALDTLIAGQYLDPSWEPLSEPLSPGPGIRR